MKNLNKHKWFVLVPMMVMLLIFVTFVFLVIKARHNASIIKTKQAYESLISDVDSAKQDVLIKNKEWKRISNPKLEVLWQETYDNWWTNIFNILEWVSKWEADSSDEIQFLDKLITNKTPELKILSWKNAPSKINNVFEIDLIDFINNDWLNVTNIAWMNIDWGTTPWNTPDFYLLLGRIKKNATIDLNEDYMLELSKIRAWKHLSQYTKTNSNLDNYAFDYLKIPWPGGECTTWSYDYDLWFNWCSSVTINDFLSNEDFDLANYFYKMYLVFWIQDLDQPQIPFKLTSSNWVFGLWNITNLDVTILTPNNTKRRVILKTANKNNVLPYLVYSLWVRGKINLDWDDS